MKNSPIVAFLMLALTTCSCNAPAPQQYFEQAVLNSNMLAGFAGRGMEQQLEQPSVKLVQGSTDKTVPVTRKETIDGKIQWVEEALEKIKKLKETDDSRAILQASVALHEFVLPVYKNEYLQLAKLYDDGAPADQVKAYAAGIHDKYAGGFETLYNKLITEGKQYAAKHDIKVQWND